MIGNKPTNRQLETKSSQTKLHSKLRTVKVESKKVTSEMKSVDKKAITNISQSVNRIKVKEKNIPYKNFQNFQNLKKSIKPIFTTSAHTIHSTNGNSPTDQDSNKFTTNLIKNKKQITSIRLEGFNNRKELNNSSNEIQIQKEDPTNIRSEILNSIQNFGNLLKTSNISINKYENILNNEDDIEKLKDLNTLMSKLNINTSSTFQKLINNDKIEKNDKSFYGHRKNKSKSSSNLWEIDNKENIIGDIYISSDLRINLYSALFDFLSHNLKEIKEVITVKPKRESEFNLDSEIIIKSKDFSSEIFKLDSQDNKDLLKVSILNSTIKESLPDTVICDCDDSDIQEHENKRIPKRRRIRNINGIVFQRIRNKSDMSKSFIISSIGDDFYKNLFDQSFTMYKNMNISTEMGEFNDLFENTLKIVFDNFTNSSVIKEGSNDFKEVDGINDNKNVNENIRNIEFRNKFNSINKFDHLKLKKNESVNDKNNCLIY